MSQLIAAVIQENNLPNQWLWCPLKTDFWSVVPKVDGLPDAYVASLNTFMLMPRSSSKPKYMWCTFEYEWEKKKRRDFKKEY